MWTMKTKKSERTNGEALAAMTQAHRDTDQAQLYTSLPPPLGLIDDP